MKAIQVKQPFSIGRFFLLGILAISLFTSCEEENTVTPQVSFDEGLELSLDEVDAEGVFEEIEEIALGVEEETSADPSRRIAMPPIILWECADITRDTLLKTITIDFGAGCTGADGRTRSGIILVTYTKPLHMPGASRSIELNNYKVDSVAVEGKRTLSNITDGPEGFISFNSTLEGGRITWPDGTEATRDYSRTRTWLRGNNPLQDEFQKTGSVEGTTREGVSYSISINTPLIYKRSCRRAGIFIAVGGEKTVERSGKETVSIDYGAGECDSIVTLTIGEESREVNVREELRKRRRRK